MQKRLFHVFRHHPPHVHESTEVPSPKIVSRPCHAHRDRDVHRDRLGSSLVELRVKKRMTRRRRRRRGQRRRCNVRITTRCAIENGYGPPVGGRAVKRPVGPRSGPASGERNAPPTRRPRLGCPYDVRSLTCLCADFVLRVMIAWVPYSVFRVPSIRAFRP